MSPVRVRLGPLRGSVAQSVEQGTENPRVACSIQAGTTNVQVDLMIEFGRKSSIKGSPPRAKNQYEFYQYDVINDVCNRISEVVTLLIRGLCSKLGQTACPDDVRSAFRAQLCVSLTSSKTVYMVV